MWLSAEEAVRRLAVKPQTLYASVSRGRVRAKPDPADPRRSLYDATDIERLMERRGGPRAAGAVAAETIRWGEPVLPSEPEIIVECAPDEMTSENPTYRLHHLCHVIWLTESPPAARRARHS